jgi:hypothetical protein
MPSACAELTTCLLARLKPDSRSQTAGTKVAGTPNGCSILRRAILGKEFAAFENIGL